MDDFCLMAKLDHMADHCDFLLDMLNDLGWTINIEKSVLEPNKSCTFLDFKLFSSGP